MVFNKEKSIQIVKPYLEELAKNYNGYVKEDSPIAFGKMYNASTDNYNLVLHVEHNFELGIRFSENENTIAYIANAYFMLFDNGKQYKVHKTIDSAVLSEANIKKTIQKFKEAYHKSRTQTGSLGHGF